MSSPEKGEEVGECSLGKLSLRKLSSGLCLMRNTNERSPEKGYKVEMFFSRGCAHVGKYDK